MSLIEQLGGYEKAKGIFILNDDDYEFYSPHFEYYSEKAVYDDSLDIKNIEHVLLEHRRQHNIFEVGDKVVYNGEAGLSGLFEIEILTKTGKPKTVKTKRFGNFPCRYCEVRHATDKEIAQGYRDE